jgi:hypothetical protein
MTAVVQVKLSEDVAANFYQIFAAMNLFSHLSSRKLPKIRHVELNELLLFNLNCNHVFGLRDLPYCGRQARLRNGSWKGLRPSKFNTRSLLDEIRRRRSTPRVNVSVYINNKSNSTSLLHCINAIETASNDDCSKRQVSSTSELCHQTQNSETVLTTINQLPLQTNVSLGFPNFYKTR